MHLLGTYARDPTGRQFGHAMTVEIRLEHPGDVDQIRTVTASAFAGSEHGLQNEVAIVDALRAAGALTPSLVAASADEVLGHAAFSPVTIEGEDRGWFGLGPVSVRPDHQRQGLGQALIHDGLERLRQNRANGCVVLGEPAYYCRFGFEHDPLLILEGIPGDYFSRLTFRGPDPSGAVRYHHGFDACDR